MITALRLINFKNFVDETLCTGPFTLLIGANASGKSNVRDAIRILNGIGKGYSLSDIIEGNKDAGWEPIRGAVNEIVRYGQTSFSLGVDLRLRGLSVSFTIEVGIDHRTNSFYLQREKFEVDSTSVYSGELDASKRVHDSGPFSSIEVEVMSVEPGTNRLSCSPYYSILQQLLTSRRPVPGLENDGILKTLSEFFSNLRTFNMDPFRMRIPAFPGKWRLSDHGDNFSVVLRNLYETQGRKELLTDWINEMTPMDVRDIKFLTDPSGQVHIRFHETNGQEVSVHAASDGTLRFLGILAAMMSGSHCLYVFEEIETGIHPSRLWLLIELIETRTSNYPIQIIATTHSPNVLACAGDNAFEHAAVIGRLEGTSASIIRRISSLPNASELRKSQDIGRLLTGGWMEDALEFTREDDDIEESHG